MIASAQQNGRAATEVATPPVVADQGPIRHGDSAKDSALVSPEQAQRHSLEAVGVGITRFLDAFRASFGTDAAPELDVPVLCIECGQYPAAWMQRCFSCQASRRVPTC